MGNYSIFETKEFANRMDRLPAKDRGVISKKLSNYVFPQLRQEPHYGKNIKKLVNFKPDVWRYRIGKFRVFYSVVESEKIIYLLTVEHRKDAY